MCSVDISIRHDDDTVISGFRRVKSISDTTTDSGDEVFDLFIDVDLVDACLLGIQYLSSEWEDSLEFSIATLLR